MALVILKLLIQNKFNYIIINQQNIGPKNKRNKNYYTFQELQFLCANCHSLKYITWDNLNVWPMETKFPGNQKYKII